MNPTSFNKNTPRPAGAAVSTRPGLVHASMAPSPGRAMYAIVGTAMALLIASTIAWSGGAAGRQSTVMNAAAESDASGATRIVLKGRGWGHGRGLGQYGALGYAENHGWTSAQILNHFYGGTTAGVAPSPGEVDPNLIRVDLRSLAGRATEIALSDGQLHIMNGDGATVARVGGAVRLSRIDGGFTVASAADCGGPWTDVATVTGAVARVASESTADGADGLLQACGTSRTWYDGEIWAVLGSGEHRTINAVAVEDYLRGVVPREIPALWPEAALEAQAVAARSYAMAGDTRWGGWADSCDTTRCQVYEGRYTTRRGSFASSTHDRTDAAIAATANLVRLTASGTVARTEFSSSTGGWTAGGDFPAVADLGDSVEANPNHRWEVSLDPAVLERRYSRGTLLGIGVTENTGVGPGGGRAVTVEMRFNNGTVEVSGAFFRRLLGLKSDWFVVDSYTRDGRIQAPIDPASVTTYIEQVHQRLGGRAPSGTEQAEWSRAIQGGNRASMVRQLVRSPAHIDSVLDELYSTTLGRSSDAAGKEYWRQKATSGLSYEQLGTHFYGSLEYYRRAGNTDAAFVDALYRDLLGRSADAQGRRYWTDLLSSGRAEINDVAFAFHRSTESRRVRANSIHQKVFGSGLPSAPLNSLADRLLVQDDFDVTVDLAVDLAGRLEVSFD